VPPLSLSCLLCVTSVLILSTFAQELASDSKVVVVQSIAVVEVCP
jgi:hypothetical protein